MDLRDLVRCGGGRAAWTAGSTSWVLRWSTPTRKGPSPATDRPKEASARRLRRQRRPRRGRGVARAGRRSLLEDDPRSPRVIVSAGSRGYRLGGPNVP